MWVVLSWFYGPLKCVHPCTLLGTEGERAFSLYSVANWLTNNNASKSGPQTSFTLYSLQITMSSINIIRILPNLICQLVHWEWINKWIQKTFGQPSYWQFVKLLWGTSYCAIYKQFDVISPSCLQELYCDIKLCGSVICNCNLPFCTSLVFVTELSCLSAADSPSTLETEAQLRGKPLAFIHVVAYHQMYICLVLHAVSLS